MSVVTNVLIATGLSEDIDYLIKTFAEFQVRDGVPFTLVSVDNHNLPRGWYGGSKMLEANLFIGAYNHLNLDELVYFMQNKVEWVDTMFVQLIVKEQHEFKFKIIDLFPESD